jgi:hypothetical protein
VNQSRKDLLTLLDLPPGLLFYCLLQLVPTGETEIAKRSAFYLCVWLVETARGRKAESAAAPLSLKHPRQSDRTVACEFLRVKIFVFNDLNG